MALLVSHVGRHVDQHRVEIAQAVLSRIGMNHLPGPPRSASLFEEDDAASTGCIEKVMGVLESLAQSLSVTEPVLFGDYIEWFRDVSSHPHPTRASTDLREGLSAVEQVLSELLPAPYFEAARPYLAAGFAALPDSAAAESDAADQARREAEAFAMTSAGEYLDRLLALNRRGARDIVSKALRGDASIDRIYLEILQPALREVGRRWQSGQLRIAQEHYCTAETGAILARLAFDTPWSAPATEPNRSPGDSVELSMRSMSAPKAFLAACVAGEYHDIGLKMTADLLGRAGWEVHFLGANTPAEAIAAEAEACGATVVGLSATLATHLNSMSLAIRTLRRHPTCGQLPILVGGRPFLLAPGLAERLGAAGARDAHHAVEMAQTLAAVSQK